MKLHYNWTLKDAYFPKNRGNVFSCFACGGGSTMGYKLAGFDVIGCNEIDPKMMSAYRANHNPKYIFLEPIQTFKDRKDLPEELFDLDILDGSPPCSSFSMAGSREEGWGTEKKFREGQAEQVLDTLFFDFIELAKRLKPKVVIAENVKGLLFGEAKGYVNKILHDFDKAGYFVRYDLLDASRMGVPQRRDRVFFSAIRKDIYQGKFDDIFESEPSLKLKFDEKKILYGEFFRGDGPDISAHAKKAWDSRIYGDKSISECKKRAGMKESDFNNSILYKDEVLPTITGKGHHTMILFDVPKYISNYEMICGGSFPQDYDFTVNKPGYIIGMSVPPLMTARLADAIANQWLNC